MTVPPLQPITDENRVQREWYDKGYSGFNADCRGCLGSCTCSAMLGLMPALTGQGLIDILWAPQGTGKWKTL